ncbi:hypothetical protein BBJ28_00014573 [Nothophytophthora sp. Chile5]|nr:hypothetical protein BBJ28_00014573 [Nothophytophthora sp. Chile5]
MAAARRNVLNGASHWEREEKATQQRDYAAQLQEQQAKQEQERARRKQEQQEELAMLVRGLTEPGVESAGVDHSVLVGKGRPKTPQQQDQGQTVLLPPPQRGSSQSLQLAAETRQQELPHSPPLAATSASLNGIAPLDNEFSVGMAPLSQQVLSSPAKYGEAASTALAFSSGPSVFESLLREPGVGTRSVAFYEDLEALQRLTAEVGCRLFRGGGEVCSDEAGY